MQVMGVKKGYQQMDEAKAEKITKNRNKSLEGENQQQ